MKRKLFINCKSGASGDMVLGAFLDLGVSEETLRNGLDALGVNEFTLDINKTERNGIEATDVDVILNNKENALKHPYSGKYRNYREIREIIDNSGLSDRAKDLTIRIFDIKAAAESKVHGVPEDEVQFHEAGAVDSIVDIAGCAICLDSLDVDEVISCSVPTGYGTVMCACGKLPVPAPAVQEILDSTGLPHYRSDIEQELLTPTGAAIMAAVADRFDDTAVDKFNDTSECSTFIRMGYGTGKRDTGLDPLCFILVEEQEV